LGPDLESPYGTPTMRAGTDRRRVRVHHAQARTRRVIHEIVDNIFLPLITGPAGCRESPV
jgi:hypothetical protein